jgi:hypothetical protein
VIVHVYPRGDSMEHAIDGSPCPCAPRREGAGDGVVLVHDALDGVEPRDLDVNPWVVTPEAKVERTSEA